LCLSGVNHEDQLSNALFLGKAISMLQLTRSLMLILAVLGLCRAAVSQDLASYQGKQVMVITDGAEFKDKQKVVARASLGDVYLAEKVNGPWLFVRDREGWIRGRM
jgi:hypothetical protein